MEQEKVNNDSDTETPVPDEFVCPLTLSIMVDPCISKYGHSFERAAILEYLARGNVTCPLSRRPMRMRDIITNHKLRLEIRRWQRENDEDITIVMDSNEYNTAANIMGYISIAKETSGTERTVDDEEFLAEPQETIPQREPRRRRIFQRMFRSRN